MMLREQKEIEESTSNEHKHNKWYVFALQFFIYRKIANNNVQYIPSFCCIHSGCIYRKKIAGIKNVCPRIECCKAIWKERWKKDLCMYLLYAIQRFLCSFLLHSTVIATYFIRERWNEKGISSTPNFFRQRPLKHHKILFY